MSRSADQDLRKVMKIFSIFSSGPEITRNSATGKITIDDMYDIFRNGDRYVLVKRGRYVDEEDEDLVHVVVSEICSCRSIEKIAAEAARDYCDHILSSICRDQK